MIRYHKDSERSNIAAELLVNETRGLFSVTVALPELSIVGGYFCYQDDPLTVVPSYFLLDEQERVVIDPLFPDRSGTYFVAGTWKEIWSKDGMYNKIAEVGKTLEAEGFSVKPQSPDLRLVL